jgi:CDGSH-type Zn-finger protein
MYQILNPFDMSKLILCDDEHSALEKAIRMCLADEGHPAIKLYCDGVHVKTLKRDFGSAQLYWGPPR